MANALDRASTACFTVGIATPIAGYLYNVSNFRMKVRVIELGGGFAVWLLAVVALHYGSTCAQRIEAVNEYWVLAFIITPAVVVAMGYVAVRLHERSLKH